MYNASPGKFRICCKAEQSTVQGKDWDLSQDAMWIYEKPGGNRLKRLNEVRQERM